MKRRNFIKRSSLVAGAILAHQVRSVHRTSGDSVITVGLIGCGARGKGILAGVLKKMTGKFKVVALCDVLDFRLREAAAIIPASALYTDYRSMLDDKTIDAIIIATPLYLHYQMASAALKAGKHIYLEKTMTYSKEEALNLMREAGAHPSQVVQIGHQLPYTPLYRKVREMITKGYLGKVTQIDCRYDRNSSWRRPVPDPSLEKNINWRMYKAFSGGLTAEILSHQIEFINWAFNTRPDRFYSTGGIDFYNDGRETDDNVQVMLRYDHDHMIGNFGATCSNSREGFIFKIKGSKGTIELLMDDGVYYPEPNTKSQLEMVDGVAGATKIEWEKNGGIAIVREPMKDATWYAFDDFYSCIREHRRPLTDIIAGGTAAICVDLSNIALYTGSVQQWSTDYDI